MVDRFLPLEDFVNLDYTGSFDNDKVDPDLNNQAEDSYKSQYNKYAFNSHVSLSPKKRIWFKSLDLTLSASYEYDLIKRTKLVQLTRQTVAATATTQGFMMVLSFPINMWLVMM